MNMSVKHSYKSNGHYNIYIIGDGGVGKTTYIYNIINNAFTAHYKPTIGIDSHAISYDTSYGIIKFNIYDYGGQQKYNVDKYFKNADGCIIMVDCTSSISLTNTIYWYHEMIKINPTIPIIVCLNKVDIEDNRKIYEPEFIKFVKKHFNTIFHYSISVKSKYNIDIPIIALARLLKGKPDLTIERSTVQLSIYQLSNENSDVAISNSNIYNKNIVNENSNITNENSDIDNKNIPNENLTVKSDISNIKLDINNESLISDISNIKSDIDNIKSDINNESLIY
jgi:small GTP-binding protein